MEITKYKINNRKSCYGVKWKTSEKTNYKFFESIRERNIFYNKLIEKRKRGDSAFFHLSSKDSVLIKGLIDELGSIDVIYKACQEYKERHLRSKTYLLRDLCEQWVEQSEFAGKNHSYLKKASSITKKFLEMGYKYVADVTQDDAQYWINSLRGLKPSTVKDYNKIMKAVYNWGIQRKITSLNPFENNILPKIVLPEPEFLSVKDMEILMNTAKEHFPEGVAYLALNGFAGLRSSACTRIKYEDINFEQKGFLIRAEIAKNNKRVYLDGHTDNLWKWLYWARDNKVEGFSLNPNTWRNLKKRLQDYSGIIIPHNGLRHSFCTYHVALYGDAGRTATLLTHRGNVSILYEHYKGNTTKVLAEKYFSIIP